MSHPPSPGNGVFDFLFQAQLAEPLIGDRRVEVGRAIWADVMRKRLGTYVDQVTRFEPADVRCTERGSRGCNLATLAILIGQRFSSPEGILLKMAQKGFDLSQADDRGQVAAVRGWGDLETLTAEQVRALMEAGVDFSMTADDNSVLTSSFVHPYPLQPGVADLIREGVEQGLALHPLVQQSRRLRRLKATADPEHHGWLGALMSVVELARLDSPPKKHPDTRRPRL